ncbi:hypothetical protein [Microcystis phage MaeS]|nr:hypothetical protein [Microcystis phage MaeS]
MATINWNDSLQHAKELKELELNVKCNEAILGRFKATVDGVEYYFSNDGEAQDNFKLIDKAFDRGWTTEEKWTAYDEFGNVVRVILTKEKFDPVFYQHMLHIQSNISKFRDVLMPKVKAATTIQEINEIVW